MKHIQRLKFLKDLVQLKILLFVLIGLCSISIDCFAQDDKSKSENSSFEKQFIENNKAFSKWLDQLTEKIDIFLVGKKITNKKNDTHLKIQNSTFKTEDKPVINTFSVSLNPRFPNLEQYLQLKFTSTDVKEESRRAISEQFSQNQTEKKYEASVGLFQNFKDIKTSFQPRIALQNPVKLSYSLIFETASNYSNSVLNPKIELFADADKGIGFYNSVNLYFSLTPIYSLTLINEAEYIDRLHQYTVNNGFSIGQVWSPKLNLGYSLIFTSNNRPNYHLTSYTVAFSWNQLIYKKILDFQLIPQLEFPKSNQFKGLAGITFNLNLNF